jgi:hypothetical protein
MDIGVSERESKGSKRPMSVQPSNRNELSRSARSAATGEEEISVDRDADGKRDDDEGGNLASRE